MSEVSAEKLKVLLIQLMQHLYSDLAIDDPGPVNELRDYTAAQREERFRAVVRMIREADLDPPSLVHRDLPPNISPRDWFGF